MKLEKQVSNLELSKRLKELGVKQESIYTWVESFGDNKTYKDGTKDGEYKLTDFCRCVSNYYARGYESDIHPMYHAYTVAELGEMLPDMFIWADGSKVQIASGKIIEKIDQNKWATIIVPADPRHRLHIEKAETEADARAKMLIYLLENNLLDPKTLS